MDRFVRAAVCYYNATSGENIKCHDSEDKVFIEEMTRKFSIATSESDSDGSSSSEDDHSDKERQQAEDSSDKSEDTLDSLFYNNVILFIYNDSPYFMMTQLHSFLDLKNLFGNVGYKTNKDYSKIDIELSNNLLSLVENVEDIELSPHDEDIWGEYDSDPKSPYDNEEPWEGHDNAPKKRKRDNSIGCMILIKLRGITLKKLKLVTRDLDSKYAVGKQSKCVALISLDTLLLVSKRFTCTDINGISIYDEDLLEEIPGLIKPDLIDINKNSFKYVIKIEK